MRLIKNLGLNVLLVGASSFVVLLCIEGALRFTSYVRFLPYEGTPQFYYTASRDAGYDIAPNFASSTHRFKDGSHVIWSNELGCFDVPYRDEKKYSLLVGDSFAWGFTSFEDKWGTHAETLLGERILKCGVAGYGTRQEWVKAKNVLEIHPNPKRIILSYFSNDKGDDEAFPNSLVYEGKIIKNLSADPTLTYEELEKKLSQFAYLARQYCMWNEPAHPLLQKTKCYLRKHSIVYLLVQDGIKNVVPVTLLRRLGIVNEEPVAVEQTDAGETAHFQNILAFKSLAQKSGADLIVVLIPTKEDTYATATTTSYRSVELFLREQKIEYLNPVVDFRRTAAATSSSLYWKEDLHFNEKGNRLLGFIVASYLAKRDRNMELVKTIKEQLQSEFNM